MYKIKEIIKYLIPDAYNLPLRYFHKKLCGKLDYELIYLRSEVKGCYRAIDIGANIGIYSYSFSKYCKKVDSFEPVSEITRMLKQYAEQSKNIKIYNVGLSNKSSRENIHIPYVDGTNIPNIGLASLNDFGVECKKIEIEICKLDDYSFVDVGIIKIDVEGHEYQVLEGAEKTIRKYKPFILIEIEQRHLVDRPMNDTFDLINSFGYRGYFFHNKKKYSIDDFIYEVHQKPYLNDIYSENYINNFIFEAVHE
jgi:FkbM family methyltransferase